MCEITSGYSESGSCAIAGGFKYAIFYNISDREDFSLSATKGTIDTLSLKSGKNAFKVELDQEKISGLDTGTYDRASNSLYFEQSAVLMFTSDSVAFSEWLMSLEGAKIGVILMVEEEKNGVNRHLGLNSGLAGAGETVLGQTMAEGKPTTLNLAGKEIMRAPSISTATATALLSVA